MYGTALGNIIAILYFTYFQVVGFLLARTLFHRENAVAKLLLGSSMGSLLMTWTPVLMAFFFDFTQTAHIAAALLILPAIPFALYYHRGTIRKSAALMQPCLYDATNAPRTGGSHNAPLPSEKSILARKHSKDNLLFFSVFTAFLLLWGYLLHTHTILPNPDGGMYTGQCTYGDMNMHLGFITSLTVQQTFPPDYSIMPGVRLSYPFLSDSISSSLYCFGSSLRLSYILPMFFAMAQILMAVYLLAQTLFASLRKSMLTLLFFFLNGGLGFAYFCNFSGKGTYSFSDIFTGFYITPTNLIGENIRWVNVIADMFLPQRATLFGYATLFPALWLLYRAVFEAKEKYFFPAGLFVAALPMIHTHSFLSAAIISASWLLLWLYRRVGAKVPTLPRLAPMLMVAFTVIMYTLQLGGRLVPIPAIFLMLLGILPFMAAVIYGIFLLCRYLRGNGIREILSGWGCYLAILLILALPQLLFWTFGQVSEGGFVRGHFNWGNLGDSYLWFYLKNLGVVCVLIIGSLCTCNTKKIPLFLPALFLWWLGELIVFTPNTYDNNKLLYVAYLLLCLAAADYAVDIYERFRHLPGRRALAFTFLTASVVSALLTLGREVISQYQLYNPAQVALAEYIEENLEPDAIFLSSNRHNNEIASLTGRSIVCGADNFLFFHGLDTTQRKEHLRLMYEAPAENMDLYRQYQVDYIVLSNYEKSSYHIEKSQFDSHFTKIYTYLDITLYQVNP